MPQELYRLSANGWDRKHWKRVALITHERHIEDLKARGEIHDVLVISSDWLLWQQCANQKIACMSIEAALISNPIDAYWRRQLLVQGNSWVYDGDDDMTLFQGASVGKLFNTEMTIALSAYLRISTALRTIIQDHKIEELIYYDVRAETNLINNDLRFQIARDVATQDKISCIDRMDALEPDDPAQPMVPEGAGPHHSIMRRVATRVATMLMAVTTNLLTFRNRRRRGALIAVQQPIMIPLLLRNSRAKLYPLFWPEWMPKKPAFMNIYRKCGARFMSLANLKLSGREIERFESLIGGLTKDWDTGLTTPHGFIRHYVSREIIDTGRLTKMAHKVKTVVYRFQKAKPRVVLVDGVKNYPHRTFLDLARHHGCKTFYIWHAPLSSEEFGYDALGNEPRQSKLVDHVLAWGELEEPWLQLLGVDIPTNRTGTPHLVAPPATGGCQAAGTQKIKRVLILDYSVIASDLLATNATKYEFLVDVVQKLCEIGVEEIRFKLHPGRPRKSYYDAIVDSFELDCTVYKSEPIEELTDWADAVIGPVHSSSMLKVISRGKDYYAFLLQPTWQNEQCFKRINILNSVSELEAAFAEKRHAGGPEKLDHITSWLSINDPAREIWNTLDQYA